MTKVPTKPPSKPSVAFLRALQREHNAPATPFLPRSIAAIRKATYLPDMVGRKPLDFRSRKKRK